MSKFSELDVNAFLVSVLKDGEVAFSDIEVDKLATELPEHIELSEYQKIKGTGTIILYSPLVFACFFVVNKLHY
ncbi:MAG: hypothetical protein RBR08_13540 [Desulforegulaceae bacterium]|nr:hypothetical protein [Desulforegulaceae bacterium]